MSRITQRGATGPLAIQANGTFQTSTDASLETLLGSRWDLSDGRVVALGQASSATTVTPGLLYQNAAVVPNHQNLATTVVTAYSNNGNVPASITVTLGATAATANQYQGGYLAIVDGTGEGQLLKIASHPAADASATLKVTLEDGWTTLPVAATSEVSLFPATGNAVIIHPTTPTNSVFGLSMYNIAASAYGFFLTNGIGNALSDAVVAGPGVAISWSATVAGAVAGVAYANDELTAGVVGSANILGVSGEYRPVTMNIG